MRFEAAREAIWSPWSRVGREALAACLHALRLLRHEHRPPGSHGNLRASRRRWVVFRGRDATRCWTTIDLQGGGAARRAPRRAAARALHTELEPYRCRPHLL